MLSLTDWRLRARAGEEAERVVSIPGKFRAHFYATEGGTAYLEPEEWAILVSQTFFALCSIRRSAYEWKAAPFFADDLLRRLEETWGATGPDVFEGVIELEPERTDSAEHSSETESREHEGRSESDLDWLSSNLEELRRVHGGHWVAIVEGEVCAIGTDVNDLVEAVSAAGIATPLVTFIPEEEVTWRMAYDLQSI